jgi:hypothetical protein
MTNSIKLISIVCSVAVAYLVAVLWQNSSNSCGRPQVMEPLPPPQIRMHPLLIYPLLPLLCGRHKWMTPYVILESVYRFQQH